MFTRCLVPAALFLGCAPASLPVSVAALHAPITVYAEPALGATPARALEAERAAHHARHLARLSPPFAGSSTTRRVPNGEATNDETVTAVATTP